MSRKIRTPLGAAKLNHNRRFIRAPPRSPCGLQAAFCTAPPVLLLRRSPLLSPCPTSTAFAAVSMSRRAHRAHSRPTERTPLLPPAAGAAPTSASSPTGALRWRDTYRFVRPYIIPETLRLRIIAAVSVACLVVNKACRLIPPFALKIAVDTLSSNATRPTGTTAIAPLMAIFVFFLGRFFSSLAGSLQAITYSIVSLDSTRRFSVAIFEHLQNLSLSYHLQRKTGEITRIMSRGVDSVDTIMSTFLFTLAPTVLETVVVAGIFVKLGSPLIALCTMCSVVLYIAFTVGVTQWRIQFRRELNDADNAVNDKAVDTLINYETVKMFGMETHEVASYEVLQKELQSLSVWLRASLNALNFGQAVIQMTGLAFGLALAAVSSAAGNLTPGGFVLVNLYIMQLFQPLAFLGSTYRMITRAATDLEKCLILYETKQEVQDADDAVELYFDEQALQAGKVGSLSFENVSFNYKGGTRSGGGGVQGINFTVPAGRMLAIVGASGAGKSTLIRLCLRFYDCDEGRILIDGQDIRRFTQASLRKSVGVVAQDTVLFNQSLRYNISYGAPDASEMQIYNAARASALSDFIETLPLKLDTLVGERGVRLSGGEKQRVGSARCVIKNPALVLLDEASSALDTQTERLVQANLREICRGRTTIAIAHRLSTVMMADEVIVLDNSRIVERGSHASLLAAKGKYAEMWTAQTSLDLESHVGTPGRNTSKLNGALLPPDNVAVNL